MKPGLYSQRGARRKSKKLQAHAAPAVTATVTPALELREMVVAYGVRQQTLSRMTGFSLRAVAHWVAGKEPGDAARIRLIESQRLLAALAQVVEPTAIEPWLQRPNPAFGGSTPLQVIERGESDRLWRMVYELGSGEPG